MTTTRAGSWPLVLTMGEPAGIGAEIALKAWLARESGIPPFVLLDDPDRLRALARTLSWPVEIAVIDDIAEAASRFVDALPVLTIALPAASQPGRPSAENAGAVLQSLDRAVDLVLAGTAAALVTNPIHKKSLYDAGFRHPGHTEYLAERGGAKERPVMLLTADGLRVVPVTVHLPLARVPDALDTDLIVSTGRTVAAALSRDFGLSKPRLAVAGLNPHAGEDGALGREEADVIAPAVARLTDEGIAVRGPYPADSLFHAGARHRYDAVLCMYHDQALIPLKTVDFDGGVNVTLGLPFVRTSPDHGTAFDIAGTGRASARSLIAALHLAAAMARRRAATDG